MPRDKAVTDRGKQTYNKKGWGKTQEKQGETDKAQQILTIWASSLARINPNKCSRHIGGKSMRDRWSGEAQLLAA